MLSSAALLWLALTETVDTWPYYVALFVFGCTRAFTGPAVQSLLPQIVAREHLAQAIATNSMIMKVAVIAGPLLGGLLYAAIGGWTFGVCLLGFAIGVLLLQWVPSVRIVRPVDDQTTAVSRFTAGIRFITSRPIILGAISLDLFAVLLGGVVALLPIYAAEILHVGPAGRSAAQRHRTGRAGHGLLFEHPAAQRAHGPAHVPGCGGVRRGQPGVRLVDLVLGVLRGTVRRGRSGHDQCVHPLFVDPVRHPR